MLSYYMIHISHVQPFLAPKFLFALKGAKKDLTCGMLCDITYVINPELLYILY